jgi:translation elongation factor EF-Tu-like GTPase
MEDLVKKIENIVDLVKAMMASIKTPSLNAGNNSLRMPKTPKFGIKEPATGVAPTSKKNPIKAAEQLSDPGIKKDAVKAAKETIKVAPNGQWTLK